MPSSQHEKSVRFSTAPDNDDAFDHKPLIKRKVGKDAVDRMNEDELDDVDEWNPEYEADEGSTLTGISERDLREAKRQRRTKRVVGVIDNIDDDDGNPEDSATQIDYRTSLAAEGIKIEPFNMDQERNDGSGYFDGDTYIFRKRDGENDEIDAWVEGLDNGEMDGVDIQRSRIAMVQEDERRKEKSNAIDERMDNWSENDLYTKLLLHLEGNETVTGALIRYGNLFQTKKSGKTGSALLDADARRIAQDAFNDITEASNALLLKGKIDIYQLKRADIEGLQKKSQLHENLDASESAMDSLPKPTKIQWEYKGNQDGQIHGPFSTEEMLGWLRMGYFVGEAAVQVRTVQESPSMETKSMQEDLLSDLMSEDNQDADRQNALCHFQRGEWMISKNVDFLKYL